jgi:hypothetical protein
MIIGLLWLSPLRALYYWPNNFLNQGYMQYGFDYLKYLFTYRPPVTPQFYEKLRGTPPGKYLLVEAPWNFGWHSFGYYQSLHGQRVAIGFVDTNIDNCRPGELPLGNRNFAFRNFIHVSDHARLMAEKVKYVIFHKQLLQELPNPFGDKPVDVSNRIKHYTALYGPPVYEDTLITVFNVLRSSIPLGK